MNKCAEIISQILQIDVQLISYLKVFNTIQQTSLWYKYDHFSKLYNKAIMTDKHDCIVFLDDNQFSLKSIPKYCIHSYGKTHILQNW